MQGKMASDFAKHDHADSQTENTDSILETMMAYSEIWAIINILEDSYVLRIPHQVKAFFEEERIKDYEPSIDVDIPLTEQNLQRKTIVLLALLNVNYWCDTEEEREVWLRKMAKNDHKEYDPHDMSWDLREIFDDLESVCENNNEEYMRGNQMKAFQPDTIVCLKSGEAKVEHATKVSTYAIYDSLIEISELKAVLTVDYIEKTYTQIAKFLFDKLDVLAKVVNGLHPLEPSNPLFFIRQISVSPTKKFQLWVINNQVIVFTNSEVWCVFQSVLFLEGELFIKKITWDENARIVCMSMFYIVHDEYMDYKVSFAENSSDVVNDVDKLDGNDSLLDTTMACSEEWTDEDWW